MQASLNKSLLDPYHLLPIIFGSRLRLIFAQPKAGPFACPSVQFLSTAMNRSLTAKCLPRHPPCAFCCHFACPLVATALLVEM